MTKTTLANTKDIKRKWHIKDADGQILGRLATEVARLLTGKYKPDWTPHIDTGDFVIITNAAKIKVTGAKLDQKKYHHYSGYPGGISEISLRKLLDERPTAVFHKAVFGMLPKNKLRRSYMNRLKIYSGAEHPHQAQAPSKKESE